MKFVTLSLVLLFCTSAFSQSAKKRNKQLTAQVALEQQKQDSAYALFEAAERKSDSIRMVLKKKISRMTDAERAASRAYSDGTDREKKLIALGVDPNVVVHYDSQIESIPKYMGEVKQAKEIIRTEVKFNKVSDKLNLDGLKVKEQNTLLQEKITEYQDHAGSNKMRQQELDAKNLELLAFSPKLDSLTSIYEVYKEALLLKKTKLQNKLGELRADYAQKGPKGFSEAYRKVFPDVFPVLQDQLITDFGSETLESEGYIGQDIVPVPKDDKKPGASEIYTIVDEQASFPGGIKEMYAYLEKNLRYPESAKEAAISGKVFVQFVVSEKGDITESQVVKGIRGCKECDLEAIRVIRMMPKWIPAKINGQAVKSKFNLPVNFVSH
ncbi:Gram-negative bacterial tonB protein [compost metagenome]